MTDLPLVAGHPALDLINTVERGSGTPARDFLAGGADLLLWAGRAELLSAAEASRARSTAGRALPRVTQLREALHAVVLAQLGHRSRPPLGLLHERWVQAVGRSRFQLGEPGAPLVRGPGPGVEHLVEDRIAEAAVTLLTGPRTSRIRRCPTERGGCGWVFLDSTRNASRTWCRMADCGNQVKAARLTERRRQRRSDPKAE